MNKLSEKGRQYHLEQRFQTVMNNPSDLSGKTAPDYTAVWNTSAGELHLEPRDVSAGYLVRPGIYELNGAHEIRGGVNFTIQSAGATAVTLLLYHRGMEKPFATIPFPEKYRIGQVWSMIVFDLDIMEFEYAYSVDGPWDPEKGLLFDPSRSLLDIYARAVTGQSVWGVKNPGFYKARVVRNSFDWGKEHFPRIPMEDLVIYELHVRGFTRHPSSGVSAPGTFRGLIEKIPYLKSLGVNAVELMPVFEFDESAEEREYQGERLLNYWGYAPVSFFAPNTSYASTPEFNREGEELRTLVQELHRNGMECFLDVVFNHTAEGGEDGPIFSFKGFDNRIYYLLTPDGKYHNFSGCGNSMNCNHPVVQDLILSSLRYWAASYHIDGFRFDLASILGRNEDGSPMANPPVLERLACDPILSDVKLIAEAWDAGGLYQIGGFDYRGRWAEWNGRYRDDLRNFLKGDYGLWNSAAARITGSLDIYDPAKRGYSASVNFLTCHDGFTLHDLYSYAGKHNEANGWNNTDGTDDNRSWNCGVEGPADDPEILRLRGKLMRNAMAVLLLSRGTPMLLSGDEFMNSQKGNNNAYCQDNEISWLDWADLEKNSDFHGFVRALIAFRAAHPVIRKRQAPSSYGFDQLSVLSPSGGSKAMGVLYAGCTETGTGSGPAADIGVCGRGEAPVEDDGILLAVNVYWEPQELTLPEVPEQMCFLTEFDTARAGKYCTSGTASDIAGVLQTGANGAGVDGTDAARTDAACAASRQTISVTGGGRLARGSVILAPRSVQVLRLVHCQHIIAVNPSAT